MQATGPMLKPSALKDNTRQVMHSPQSKPALSQAKSPKSTANAVASNNNNQQSAIPNRPKNDEASRDISSVRKEQSEYAYRQEQEEQKTVELQEWKSKEGKTYFKHFNDLVNDYVSTFQLHTKFIGDPYQNLEEKLLVERIFDELKGSDSNVEFKKVLEFFRECPLYYRFYNIHPEAIDNVLKDSARLHADRLTHEEFVGIFLHNTRTAKDYHNFIKEKQLCECVLTDEEWHELKEIFDNLDAYGDETVPTKLFLKKITNNKFSLLNHAAVRFPSINRVYTLSKVMYQLTCKETMTVRMKWQYFMEYIEHFKPLVEPVVDRIWERELAKGQVGTNSNGFLLKQDVIDALKAMYERSPKFCSYFIRFSNFYEDIFDSQLLKHRLNDLVRSEPQLVTLRQCLQDIKAYGLAFLDLDELLGCLSIRGDPMTVPARSRVPSDTSSEYSPQSKNPKRFQEETKTKGKKVEPKIWSKESTKAVEFNLTKKEKVSIREQKLHEMLAELQQKEFKELNKRIRANPIPISNNPQKYLEYQNEMTRIKQNIRKKLDGEKARDRKIIGYLQANTRLFDLPKRTELEPFAPQHFQAKSIPWFAQVPLLQKIEQDKEQRRKKLKQEIKIKHTAQWSKLPEYAKAIDNGSEENIQSEFELLESLEKKNHAHQNRSVAVKPVPNFAVLHEQFQSMLAAKRAEIPLTKIREFKLTSPKAAASAKVVQTEVKAVVAVSPPKRTENSSPVNFIGSTVKFDTIMKMKQHKKLQLEIEEDQEKQEKLKKDKEKKIFAKFVRAAYKEEAKKQKKIAKKACRKLKSQEKQFCYEAQLAEMYKRILSRPFLFQKQTQTSQKHSPEAVLLPRSEPEPQPLMQQVHHEHRFSSQDDSQHESTRHHQHRQNNSNLSF